MSGKFFIELILGSLIAISAQAGDLKVTLEGIRSGEGAVMIGLYDSPEGFESAIRDSAKTALLNKKNRLVGVSMRAKTGSQSIIFTELPPGRYAIIVFHDENDNGLLDENALGMPTEGYGFSNDARELFSAPTFEAAAVPASMADMSISISLVYPKVHSAQDWLEFRAFLGR